MGRKFGEHLTNSPRVDSCNGRLLQGDDDKITPGCYNICFNCGCLSVYTEDLALRRPTNTERYDAGIEVNRVIIAIKQRGRLR